MEIENKYPGFFVFWIPETGGVCILKADFKGLEFDLELSCDIECYVSDIGGLKNNNVYIFRGDLVKWENTDFAFCGSVSEIDFSKF